MLNIRALDLGGPQAFSHRFAEGAITVVLGRNNAGKTRLARAVAGLDPSPPGTLFINGERRQRPQCPAAAGGAGLSGLRQLPKLERLRQHRLSLGRKRREA